MSTAKQLRAYQDILAARRRQHLIATYGMEPIRARHPGHCPCGQIAPGRYGHGEQACPFGPGDTIVKFRGAWWNTACVDRVKLSDFQRTARFVLIDGITNRTGGVKTYEKAWTNDPAEAERWRRNLTEVNERVEDRGEQHGR